MHDNDFKSGVSTQKTGVRIGVNLMGCQYCSSGLGLACEGPNGLDDLEAACTCECHAENRFEEAEENEWNDDEGEGYASEELEEFGCVLGDACIMPGLHFPSECHTSAESTPSSVCAVCGKELSGVEDFPTVCEEHVSDFVWCLHCERAFHKSKIVKGGCCYLNCNGSGWDLFDWNIFRFGFSSHSEYPDIPECDKHYPQY